MSADCLDHIRFEQTSACWRTYGPLIRAALPLRRPAMMSERFCRWIAAVEVVDCFAVLEPRSHALVTKKMRMLKTKAM